MEVVDIAIKPEWHITGSLLEGFNEPVYRFIPGTTRSEGLFLCVLRKKGSLSPRPLQKERELKRVLEPPFLLEGDGERLNLPYQQAIAYLRHEALTLPPDTPSGVVTVCFQGHALGLAKNIGTRANNLYPKEWKIKTTHIPNDYEAILRHTEPHTD